MTENLASESDLFSGNGLNRRYKVVELPVAGHRVRIRSLSEREMAQYQRKMYQTARGGGISLIPKALETASRRLIVLCLVDGAGNRILNDSHIEKMGNWDAADVAFLYTECAEHTGISDADIEGMVKNSARMGDDGPQSA